MDATMDMGEALGNCIQAACRQRHLAKGLNECARSLDQRRAVLCVLSRECTEDNYTRLIMALCSEHNIPIIQVDDSKQLATWAGLARLDEDGEVKKWPKCTCVVITQWDLTNSASQTRLQEHIQSPHKE